MVSASSPNRGKNDGGGVVKTDDEKSRRWSFFGSLASEAALLVVCAVFWLETSKFQRDVNPGELGPAFVPRLLILLLAVSVLVRVAQELMRARRPALERDAEPGHTADESGQHLEEGALAEEEYPTDLKRLGLGFALAIGYVFATMYLGYPLATLLLVLVFIWTASKFTWTAVAAAAVTALLFPYVFVKLVYIALPTGVWIFDDFTVWLYRLLNIY